ncbi:MAG: hypothetical protein MJD61_00900 [Proteobacteria bacterium]|nr:hypothetical protein [Pseudomonadota bacterium]
MANQGCGGAATPASGHKARGNGDQAPGKGPPGLATPCPGPFADFVSEQSPGRYRIARCTLAHLQTGPPCLRSLRLVPFRQDGMSEGFLLVGVDDDSCALPLGFRDGDVVQELNDYPLFDARSLRTAAAAALRSREITVVIAREGKAYSLRYVVAPHETASSKSSPAR